MNPLTIERRNAIRHEVDYSATYARFDEDGRPWNPKQSRSINLSLGGVRLRSSSPVNVKELLSISVLLKGKPVSFRGEVVHVIYCPNRGYEAGISIKEITNQDRMALARFESERRYFPSDSGHDITISNPDQITCPNCGELVASADRVENIIKHCEEMHGQCSCGQRYIIRVVFSNIQIFSLH
jgi:hypothetical protein